MNKGLLSPNDITAPFYDIVWGPFTGAQKTAREVDFVAGLATPGATILDLGCGTGRHLLPLARRGYQVVGFDNSRKMLAQLKRKLSGKNKAVRLVCGDLGETRKLPAAQGAICFWNAFNEIALTKSQARRIFKSVYHALEPGGFLLIETPNPAVMDLRAGQFHHRVRSGGNLYDECFRVENYDRRHGVLTASETITVSRGQKSGRRFQAIIKQRIWTASQLRELAQSVGFKRQQLLGDRFRPFHPARSRHQIQVFYK